MVFWANVQQTVTLLIILSILVVAHEWGHFIVARLCGIRVDDFSIGFGPRLFRIAKRGDTEYNVRMLPLGGFVKIAGMEPDEAPLVHAKEKMLGKGSEADPDSKELPLISENIGDGTPYTAPDGFYSKPLWQRSLVILAGPVMSFVLGYVVFCLMGVTVGIPTGKTLNKVALAGPDGEGKRIGLRIGDVISSINGKPIHSGEEMIHVIYANAGKPLTLTVDRSGTVLTKIAIPQPVKDDQDKPILFVTVQDPKSLAALGLQVGDIIAGVNGKDARGPAGITQTLSAIQQSIGKTPPLTVYRDGQEVALDGAVPPNVAQSLPVFGAALSGRLNIVPVKENRRVGLAESIQYGNETVVNTFVAIGYLIHHRQLHKAAGGIIFMYQATGIAVKSGLPDVVSMLASLSISLAIFNLLPIPILDGGHLLTFFIEWVRRGKRLTDQQQQAFLMTGLAIIGILFVLIMSNDIIRTVTHQLPQ